MAGAIIGKAGHNIQKLRTEVWFLDNIVEVFWFLNLI